MVQVIDNASRISAVVTDVDEARARIRLRIISSEACDHRADLLSDTEGEEIYLDAAGSGVAVRRTLIDTRWRVDVRLVAPGRWVAMRAPEVSPPA